MSDRNIFVTCAKCEREIHIDDCTPVGTAKGLIFLCLKCRKRYECHICGELEYSEQTLAGNPCEDCWLELERAADRIVDSIEKGHKA